MRIVCPNCATAYDVPESVVAAGRPMRCAKCRAEWTPSAAAAPPVPPAPAVVAAPEAVGQAREPAGPETEPASEPKPEPKPAYPPPPDPDVLHPVEPPLAAAEPVILAPFPPAPTPVAGPRKVVMAGWAGSAVVLVAALWLAIAYRAPIMRHWPPSARAFAMLGYR